MGSFLFLQLGQEALSLRPSNVLHLVDGYIVDRCSLSPLLLESRLKVLGLKEPWPLGPQQGTGVSLGPWQMLKKRYHNKLKWLSTPSPL